VSPQPSLADVQRTAVRDLVRAAPVLDAIGRRFAAAGHEIALVGGSVRDALMGRLNDDSDLDFATTARPDDIERLLDGWASARWDMGRDFGTIGARVDDWVLEITTYRSDSYHRESRKPGVAFGDTLDGDLARRDFRVNAMAVRLPDLTFVDPFGGLDDLAARILRTPGSPENSFSDDPLRMLRAARFAAQLGFAVADETAAAIAAMTERLAIVSAERIRAEFARLMLSPQPRIGLQILVDTGLADQMLPELPALRLEGDEHRRHKNVYEHTLTVVEQAIALEDRLRDGGPDLITRLAALLHDIGKPRTRRFAADGSVSFHHHDVVGAKLAAKRLAAMRFSGDEVKSVARLVELHLRFHGYGSGEWTDSAVRRYVRDAGDLLDRLHVLTRADCTTRNRQKADRLRRAYDDLEARIARLAEQEELDAMRPDLDGEQIMATLGIKPGREVGEAYRFLLEKRIDDGPLGEERAREELLAWWAARS
jgi:poly(A) polymerase